MKSLKKICSEKILILASVNKEKFFVIKDDANPDTYDLISQMQGQKVKVFSLRESSENFHDENDSKKLKKFYVVWQKGEEETVIYAEEILFDGFAGSSYNIAYQLSSLGATNVSLAAFVDDSNTTETLIEECKENGIDFISLYASNIGITYALKTDGSYDPLLCMEKPGIIDCTINRHKLDEEWDAIIASSVPDNLEVLQLILDIFSRNERAVKVVIPSMRLINSRNPQITRLFMQILRRCSVLQMNHMEASEFLKVRSVSFNINEKSAEQLIWDFEKLIKIPVIIITEGKYGAAVVIETEDGNEFIYQKSIPLVRELANTTGSGDGFTGGFSRTFIQIYKKHSKKAIALAARIGAEVAMLVTGSYGGNLSQDPEKRLTIERMLEIFDNFRK